MVTIFTKTVGATARDYATIALAEADVSTIATSADLVSNDEAVVFELYNDATFSQVVVIDGSLTTDATRNVTYKAATGEAHDGTRTVGVLAQPSAGGHAFEIHDDFTVFEGMRIRSGTGSSDECFRVTTGVVGLSVRGCQLEARAAATADQDGMYGGNYPVGSAAAPIEARDCSFAGFDRAGMHGQGYNGASYTQYWRAVNCTFSQNGFHIGYRAGHATQTQNWVIINCLGLIRVNSTFSFTGTHSGTLTTTGSSDNAGKEADVAKRFPGDHTVLEPTDSTSPGAGDWSIFEDVTGNYDERDFRLVDDADNDAQALGVGPDTETLVSDVDCIGNARTGTTTDVGWHEVTPGSGAITGTGASTMGALESDASGDLEISGTGASEVAALESDASGDLEISGAAASELAPPTSDATGGLQFTATGASTLGAIESDATGDLSISGAAASELAPLTSDATGTLTATGTGASELAPLTSDATGTYGTVISGTGASEIAAIESDATGTLEISGTAASEVAALTSDATGTNDAGLEITGTGASTLGAIESDATGTLTATGTAASELAPPTSTATGGVTNSGAAASELAAITSDAVGVNTAGAITFGYHVTHDLLIQSIGFTTSALPAADIDYTVRQNGSDSTALATQTTAQTFGNATGIDVELDAGDVIGLRASATIPAPVVVSVFSRRRITP